MARGTTGFVKLIGTLATVVAMSLASLVLSSCKTVPGQSETSAVGSSATVTELLPPPISTSVATFTQPTYIPFPSPTPLPTLTLGPEAPLPQPPVAVALAQGVNLKPNMAWAVEAKDSLTVWVGSYQSQTSRTVVNPRPIVRWNSPLQLLDMSASPDNQSLAVLTRDVAASQEIEGIYPGWLSIIDLADNTVRSIPSYSHYDAYRSFYHAFPERILGWPDNDRLVAQATGAFPVVVGKDGISCSEIVFPQGGVGQIALSPDGTTFFSEAISRATGENGLWLNNVDGGNPREIVGKKDVHPIGKPAWSPYGKYISFVSPKMEQVKDGELRVVPGYRSVWLLDPTTGMQTAVSDGNTWDIAPAWSPTGSKIAFLRASAPVSNDGEAYQYPEKVQTNVFIAEVGATVSPPRRLSNTASENRELQWAPDGSIVLSSAAGGPGGISGLLSLSDVSLGNLMVGSAGEAMVHPIFFPH